MNPLLEKMFQRPSNYFQLTPKEQWDIDKRIGILDLEIEPGFTFTEEENERLIKYFN